MENETTESSVVGTPSKMATSPSSSPKSSKSILAMVAKLFGLFLLVVIGLTNTVLNGAPWRTCEYTENEVLIPSKYVGKEFFVTRKAYKADGVEKGYSCLSKISKTQYELLDSDIIDPPDNHNIGREYFTNQGRTVSDVEISKEFRVAKIIEVAAHGIGSIDSGSTPIPFAILVDSQGVTYAVMSSVLGFTEGGLLSQTKAPSISPSVQHFKN